MAPRKASTRRLVEDGKPGPRLSKRDYIAIAAEMIRADPALEGFNGIANIYFVKAGTSLSTHNEFLHARAF
jgi:hypothetical protein